MLEEKQRRAYGQALSGKPAESIAPDEKVPEEKSLEDEIFGDLQKQGHDEKTKVFGNTEKSGRIDKFYTFNKKNEAFQALLDEEYERIKMEKNRWQTKSWPLPEETAFLKKQS